ncbi:hypothetical protein [Shimia ponticola]|uniref:hypothetical protein n=1 Tax=Shimia ponticola TaxID=2582893 RepID=UPI00164BC7F6|nr:hypothetical protein [Shimia ponticola]
MAADLNQATDGYSRAEIYALLLRALRGAGVSLGWCQDVAQAVEFAGTDECLSEIAGVLGSDWRVEIAGPSIRGSGLAPIIAGCDCVLAGDAPAQVHGAFSAASAAIVAHRAATAGTSIAVLPDTDGVRLQLGNALLPEASLERFHPEPAVLETLKRFAHLTYVPETEESRQAGAGAGLTDND